MTAEKKSNKSTNTARKRTSQKKTAKNTAVKPENSFMLEVILWIIVALSLLLFISNFGFGGKIGNAVSGFFFGIFGMLAYIFPVVFLIGTFFGVSNKGSFVAGVKLVAGILFIAFLCMFIQMAITGDIVMTPVEAYYYGKEHILSGGMIGGFLTWMLRPNFGVAGSYVINVIILIISLVLLTERSALRFMERGGRKVYESARNENERRREYAMQRQIEREAEREERELQRKERQTEFKERTVRRIDKKAEGVAIDTRILPKRVKTHSDEISELYAEDANLVMPEVKITSQEPELLPEIMADIPIIQHEIQPLEPETPKKEAAKPLPVVQKIPAGQEVFSDDAIHSLESLLKEEMTGFGYGNTAGPLYQEGIVPTYDGMIEEGQTEEASSYEEPAPAPQKAPRPPKAVKTAKADDAGDVSAEEIGQEIAQQDIEMPPRPYKLPSPALLTKPKPKAGDSRQHLQETAMKLQQTLKNFGVNVTITNISCGPSVTRYELQPEMGVKVHKIVNLTDDIKLNLAATDIRMEAPIPGKAAVGIEVPNKENVTVSFRELVESKEFISHPSKIAVAVGRDIGGNVVVTDIAKMPHLLIAGATGSGKSVCINTIIMSILYKAKPDEVKMIMIDPKVVELSIYNGIPHLLIPVVTDPKKAAGALNWAVDEMTDRYNKFAECGVRDFKGYNAKIDALPYIDGEEKPEKMSLIVIIVDELADLMMVASGEVEGAICRLAQLARAAGIHLIIATQRPSVNVITGLIKANMPSRIAFAVTSGIDSRTILDMVGAEKLLGKGDMLFSPQGAPKPLRVQGAFVTDNEVTDVVKYIKEENGQGSYSSDIEEKVNSAENLNVTTALESGGGSGDGRDSYFKDAAKLLIDKQKGSIGMLQRYFKIGFNRAARIMDQLEEAGIVGPEEGTKPRQILMTEEQFEQFAEECL